MVGRDLPSRGQTRVRPGSDQGQTTFAGGSPIAASAHDPLLSIDGLGRRPCFRNVSLQVNAGEIVGLFGLVGSGRSELLETIFGLYRAEAGRVRIAGETVDISSPAQAARAGIVLVPEERQRQGLFFNLTVRHNLVIPDRTVKRDILVHGRRERQEAQALVDAWRIKTSGVDVPPDALSGGNQQKIVVAKWLALSPRVLLLDEPTKGVDVGAKFEIHEIVRREASRGLACLVASSDLPEVLALCDRVIVMREGRIQGQLTAVEATEEAVMRLATHEADARGRA